MTLLTNITNPRNSIFLYSARAWWFVNREQCRCHKIWATKRKEKTSTDLALEYFDNVYSPLFGKQWPSIRLALLSPHKYCAVVNNYCDTEKLSTQLQNEGAINIREMIHAYQNSQRNKKKTVKRKKELKHIYDLDEKLERIAAKKWEEELSSIYPEGVERPERVYGERSKENEDKENQAELIVKAKSSLEQSLAEASIDYDRQIDPAEGLSSTRLNDFVPVSKLIGKENFISEAEHYSFYTDDKDFPVDVQAEESLNFPQHLQIFAFDQGNISRFSSPKSGLTGVMGYYLMDAGSVLPVLALGLRPGDTVLDMCAAPGGKSLLCLQTLYPGLVVSNDSSLSRVNRLKRVMQEYFYDWESKVKISNLLGSQIQDYDTFSKILVDVPCTIDRHSVMENDNNIFKPSRNKERIMLPQLQVDLLFQALKLVKPGGSVVYSTCSLNPAQNDGVVQMALRRIWQETSVKIVVKDLSRALEPMKVMFQFAEPHCLKYGSLVVPYLPSNFGPMYFCKLDRIQ